MVLLVGMHLTWCLSHATRLGDAVLSAMPGVLFYESPQTVAGSYIRSPLPKLPNTCVG